MSVHGFIDQGSPGIPYAFVQWKGTDVCMDFYCECGAMLHFDGDFAYFVQCLRCAAVWEMPDYLVPRRSTADATTAVRMLKEGRLTNIT